MKKTILILLAAVMATVITVAATGCGKSSDDVSEVSTIPKATNATSAPTEAVSYGRYNSNATSSTGTTRPTGMTTSSTDTTEAETQAAGDAGGLGDIAMAYFSVSSDVGATADIIGTETAPDGTLFYNITVYYDGNAYPIYVSADGSQQLEPEYFNALFNSSQSYYEVATDAYDYNSVVEYIY